MSLMDAPVYDERGEKRRVALYASLGAAFVLVVVLFFLGFLLGHGWFFSNLPAEHKINKFFTALEAKDYPKAYALYVNDNDWQQHPSKFGYTLKQFTDDWTTDPRNFYPITSHHVDISKTDGSGFWGGGIIVAVRVNLQDGLPKAKLGEMHSTLPGHKLFMYVTRSDGTITWPAPHELQYASEY
jgi:hypothetical protein